MNMRWLTSENLCCYIQEILETKMRKSTLMCSFTCGASSYVPLQNFGHNEVGGKTINLAQSCTLNLRMLCILQHLAVFCTIFWRNEFHVLLFNVTQVYMDSNMLHLSIFLSLAMLLSLQAYKLSWRQEHWDCDLKLK